jgi:hypothetical protein
MDELKKQRRHIRDLMPYAVPEDRLDAARDLLLVFREDPLALAVLREFYSYLPDAREDWIRELRLVARKQGIFLLAAVTGTDVYLYLVSSEGIDFHGSLLDGYLDRGLLEFFEFPDPETFAEKAKSPDNFPLYTPLQADADTCPACHAQAGELHELGCPVEICPWCGGQLIHCSCRHDKLGLEEITDNGDIERFAAMLEQKGRIAFSPEQRPDFTDDGEGVELR